MLFLGLQEAIWEATGPTSLQQFSAARLLMRAAHLLVEHRSPPSQVTPPLLTQAAATLSTSMPPGYIPSPLRAVVTSVTRQIEVSLGSTTILNLQIGTTTPDIKANGSDIPITLGTSDTLLVNVSLVAGSNLGVESDWWVAAETPFGWFYFDVGIMNWTFAGGSYTDLSPTYQGPLFDLGPFEVLNMSGLPAGAYTLYFAVDTNRNGVLDFGRVVF